MSQQITIPTFYCPFPSIISPFADTLQERTLNWVQQFRLISGEEPWKRLQRSKFGLLAARAYPNAPLDRLEIVAAWNTWLFILDDQCDEWGLGKEPKQLAVLHGRCLEILTGETPDAEDPALVHAIHNIRERLQALMPLTWLTRFMQSAEEYFESTQWEAENRKNNRWPDAETYTRMRPYTGGLLTDIDLIELTESISLPISARKHPTMVELIEITNNVVCWSNDIISLQKERKHKDMHNLALIIDHHQSIGMQEAIDRVSEQIEQQVRRFMRLEHSLPHFDDKVDNDIAKFVAIMRAWMRGNLDWSFESGRYLSPDMMQTSSSAPNQTVVDLA
ncbi:terpene synthase family protein [Methylomarinum vadi]|uniref:terpene synthase family protein n=1 Tax=Methylomarinum vadi TaxID=438855 RepID=UPI000ACCC096|nr:hypothetical protein [Methylomarinum vadi]